MSPKQLFLIGNKAISFVLIFGILFSFIFITPHIAFAQTSTSTATTTSTGTATTSTSSSAYLESLLASSTDAQLRALNGSTQEQSVAGGIAGAAITGTVACAAKQLFGNMLKSSISSLTGKLANKLASTVLGILQVPVKESGPVGDHIQGDVAAKSGTYGPFGIQIGISWDAVAFCVVNALIEGIANATIEWANSGFNGNPAFIQNPERFFSDLADQTAGGIIRDIAYNATGVNVCQPFRINIAIGLANSYGNNTKPVSGLTCRLSTITQQKFFGGITTSVGGSAVSTQSRAAAAGGGDIKWSDWVEVTQQDQNNPYGAYILANQALYAGVSQKQNTLQFELGLNKGWLSFKKCKDPKDPKTCNTVTPGSLIESQLNSTLNQSKERLVMADKFDQMIDAIVNGLIKVALNKVLEATR